MHTNLNLNQNYFGKLPIVISIVFYADAPFSSSICVLLLYCVRSFSTDDNFNLVIITTTGWYSLQYHHTAAKL